MSAGGVPQPGLVARARAASQLAALDDLGRRIDSAAVAVAEEIHLMSEADAGLGELERTVLEIAERRLGRRA